MIDLLENILVPGGRARISPYVQDAQFDILFGSVPDPQNRCDSMNGILKKHQVKLQKLADYFDQFRKSRSDFTPSRYKEEDFLELYLAYYFTTNVPKIQSSLFDFVRADRISGELKVIDIGVGAGTTAVAVLDFMLAWATTCHLTDMPFPVKSLLIECHEKSGVCRAMARNAVDAFCDAVERRKSSIYMNTSMSTVLDKIVSWGRSAGWYESDIDQAPVQHAGESKVLLFASNVLSELTVSGKT